jgi:hypothetical protein
MSTGAQSTAIFVSLRIEKTANTILRNFSTVSARSMRHGGLFCKPQKGAA